jgi:hypothetical protein
VLILAFAVATLAVVLLLAKRRWHDVNPDMGTMSRQWLAEYHAQHQ